MAEICSLHHWILEKEAGMSAGTQLEQETVRRQAEILQVIFESLPMGVMVADLEGRLLSNPAAQRILDPGTCVPITPEQTTVFGWYLSDQVTVVPPERFPLLRASHGEEFTDELFFVRRLDHPEGLWISMSGGPLRDGPEPISGGVVFFQDVTERHQEIQSVTLLSRVLDQTADIVMLTDKHGKIEYVNPAFERTSGYARAEVLGRNSPYS
jgi:PAS domain-containing protein